MHIQRSGIDLDTLGNVLRQKIGDTIGGNGGRSLWSGRGCGWSGVLYEFAQHLEFVGEVLLPGGAALDRAAGSLRQAARFHQEHRVHALPHRARAPPTLQAFEQAEDLRGNRRPLLHCATRRSEP